MRKEQVTIMADEEKQDEQKDEQKAQYAKPASQLDLEARQEKGNASDRVLSTADVREDEAPVPDRAGYVGVDPIYQNSANDTEAPGASTEGAEAKVFEAFTGEKVEDLEPKANPESDGEPGDGESGTPDESDQESSPTSGSSTRTAKKTTSSSGN